MFSLIASIFRNPSVAAPCSLLTLIVAYLFSGFVIPKCKDFYDFNDQNPQSPGPKKEIIYIYIYLLFALQNLDLNFNKVLTTKR